MKQQEYRQLGETVYFERLENGLPIYVIKKEGFSKSYAFFATDYGGMDMVFDLDGTRHETPAGVAHFLEHKLFDTEDGNALQDLAANGASPNAFTSSAITAYYFESTQGFEENLRILLSFVSVPWFTQESVDKEQGIIGQEIQMIEDDPSWQVFMNLLRGLYREHPIRVSVAGTRASISRITHDTLYDCHRAFYSPSNMVLCVAGDVDPQQVVEIARAVLPREPGAPVARTPVAAEPEQVHRPLVEVAMEVSTPLFQLGFKADPPPFGEEALRANLIGELACEALLGTSTPLYAHLYERGLINNRFSYGYESYPDCAFLVAGGESRAPKAVRAAVLAEAAHLARGGVDAALWRRIKKAVYGARVRALNSFEHLCIEQAQQYFRGAQYLTFPALFEGIEKAQVEQVIGQWVREGRCTLSVVRPKKGARL